VRGDENTVLIIDQSASMKAADVPGGRFATARAEALRLLEGLAPGQSAMVIAAGADARIAAPFAEDRAMLRRAVEELEPLDVSGNLQAALRLARAHLAGASGSAAVHVFTDGAFDLGRPPDVGRAALTWHPVGRLGRNVGVTALEVRKTHFGAFDYQLFMALTNFAPEPVGFTLRISLDEREVRAEAVALEDSPNGVTAAKRAGLFCVAVPNAMTDGLPLDHADLRLASLAELSLAGLILHLQAGPHRR